MPNRTYIALANITLSGNASTVTFSSIPNTYRDLVAVINTKGLTGSPTPRGGYMTVNGSTGSSVYVLSGGSNSSAGQDGSDIMIPVGNNHSTVVVDIMDYSATDKHKTILTKVATPGVSAWFIVSRYASTNAVTSISFVGPDTGSDQYVTGSVFTLYGIAS